MPGPPRVSIVVPVCNEALVLPQTVPALLASAREVGAQVLWVCNGCTDSSTDVLRELLAGMPDAGMIEIAARGKTQALQAGDDHFAGLFPRVYIDADTSLDAGDLQRLCAPLEDGRADLVGPGHAFDCRGATRVSAAIARCWLALPAGGQSAILGVVGLSAAGRAGWGQWPNVLGDDIFVAASVPPGRSQRVSSTRATSPAPADFASWVRRRARWRCGEQQLRAMGLRLPVHPDQRRILVFRLLHGPERGGALAFVAARLAAGLLRTSQVEGWSPER